MNKRICIFAYLKNNLGDDIFIKLLCERYPNTQFIIALPQYGNRSLEKLSNLKYSKKMRDFEEELGTDCISSGAKHFFSKFDAGIIIGGSIFMQPARNWEIHLKRNINRYNVLKKMFVIGANFGPYKDRAFLDQYNLLFSKFQDICFRDTDSVAYFPENKKIRWAPDVILNLKIPYQESTMKVVISVIDCNWAGRPQFKNLSKYSEDYESLLVKICFYFYQKGYSIKLLSFCSHQNDQNAAKRIQKRCFLSEITDIDIVEYTGDIDPILSEISTADSVIATRFHAMILGLLCKKRTLPILYDVKQKNILRDISFSGEYIDVCNIDKINIEDVLYKFINQRFFQCEQYCMKSEEQFSVVDQFLKN